MTPRLCALILAAAAVTLSLTGHASNLRFMEFSPSAFFTDKDWELLREAARDALNNHADGETRTWKNPNNGHHGSIRMIRTFEDFGTDCRQVKVSNEAGNVSATRLVDLCRNKEGRWKIVQ